MMDNNNLERLRLSEILPNPFRDLKHNPLDEDKIAELVDSISSVGFMGTLEVRITPEGKYELVYGHHRLKAAIMAGRTEGYFFVKNLTDEQMLKVLSRENREVYRSSILSLIEKVRAVVRGLAEGRIEPFAIDPRTPTHSIRYAPHYAPGLPENPKDRRFPYTATLISKFLEENTKGSPEAVRATLDALHLVKIGKLDEYQIKSWNTEQFIKVTRDLVVRVAREAKLLKHNATEVHARMALRIAYEKEQREVAQLKEKEFQESLKSGLEAARAKLKQDAKAYKQKRAELICANKAREEKAKRERPAFESRMAAIRNEDDRTTKANARQNYLRQEADALLCNLSALVRGANPLCEGAIALAKRKDLDLNQRELIRKALLAASDWFADTALKFRPVPLVSGKEILKQEREKEMARQRV